MVSLTNSSRTTSTINAQRKDSLDRSLKPRAAKGGSAGVLAEIAWSGKAVDPRRVKAIRKQVAETSDLSKAKLRALEARLLEEAAEWVCGWHFEIEERAAGSRLVAGVDEVGRGPLFGPVVAAAVILPHDVGQDGTELHDLAGLNDSKQLDEEDRERFDGHIRKLAVAFAIAEVDVRTIDRINILQASRLAMRLAVEALGAKPDCLLIDGNQKIDYCPPGAICRQRTIVQGDARSFSIAAASVIAKVYRDRLLTELDAQYPGYGLASNKGYATAEHREALQRLGITEQHRRSFAPVAELFEAEVDSVEIAGELELDLEFGLVD